MMPSLVYAQTPVPYPEYQLSVHRAIWREFLARVLREPVLPKSGNIDIAILILPDGKISALQVVRNTASEAQLRIELDAIKHAKIPPPPAAALENGVFHMVIHVRDPGQT